jgi:hypothetical protein
MKKVIVVQSNGFVSIGILTGQKEPETGFLELVESSTIREWGTTRGLGEIALSGVTKKTVLDEKGTSFLNPLHIIETILCAV